MAGKPDTGQPATTVVDWWEGAVLVARDAFRAALVRQVEAVRTANPADSATVSRAADAAVALVDELDMQEFLGPLLLDHKPRLLLRFRVGRTSPLAGLGADVVLKVYGDRPRGEGPLLCLWRDRGINTPRLRFGEHAGCSWVALEHLPLSGVAPNGRAEILALTERLAGLAPRMHEPAADLEPMLRPLEQVMLPRWEAAAARLRSSACDIPVSWRDRARAAYASGTSTPLHGDLALANIAHDAAGHLVVYDASALHGRAAFDGVRWAARLATPAVPPSEIAARWAAVEGIAWGPAEDQLLATECVLEAGSRAAVRAAAGRPEEDDPGVRLLLDEARRLFERG